MTTILILFFAGIAICAILQFRKQLREYKDPPVVYENKSEIAKARNRDESGKFVGDNPNTPTNEAFKNGRRGRKKKTEVK